METSTSSNANGALVKSAPVATSTDAESSSASALSLDVHPVAPALALLRLSGIPAIGAQWVLDSIANHCIATRTLGLGHLHMPPDKLAAFLQQAGSRIEVLELSWSPAVATRTMRDIAVMCPKL